MPRYKRAYEGSTYFFTVVTHRRQPFLCDDNPRQFLREAIIDVRRRHPFKINAWVLLPDHLHCIWTLPDSDAGYSTRWALLKAGFSKRMNKSAGRAHPAINPSREKHRESGYWQRRFWEHAIRGQRDYNAHMDYIHFNPVRHGLVSVPRDWEYSSFHKLADEGVYDIEWGSVDDMDFTGIGSE